MSTGTSKVPSSNEEAEVRALIDSTTKAHREKDVTAIGARYSSDYVSYDLAPPLVHRGFNPKEKQAWLDSWEGPIEIETRDFDITVAGDYAFGHGYYRLAGTPKSAGRPVSFWMRATVCLQKIGGAWKITHEHESVPFYMDGSMRPAFDLIP
jgi:ketosteroid isomerase-like protein